MGYTQNSNPFSRKRSPLNRTWEEAYDLVQDPTHELHGTYKGMSKPEYIKEAKRQAGLYKQSGGTIEDGIATGGTWDYPSAPITESKNEANKELFTNTPVPPVDDIVDVTDERSGRQKRAGNKVKRIQERIDKKGLFAEGRPGQQARLAKAKAKAAGLSGKQARKIAKDTRRRARLANKPENGFGEEWV
tara:strand:+ start:1025 stop:1591 length:567 start_codon:yes stop_codon:yes gene_type:complete